MITDHNETIVALSTAPGKAAIAVIRLSGKDAIQVTNKVFKGKDLTTVPSHTIHFGTINHGNQIIDEVLVSVFKAPTSFTKEDMTEISCHGSDFIVQQIIRVLLAEGVRLAKPGEFTQRAFLKGRFDLAQAEAVADLIASDSEAAHHAAINQMRGGFSNEIKKLREQLIHFASMIELELDFSEEDVEFADRNQLKSLVYDIKNVIESLIASFQVGNAIKNGIPVVIVGKPNAGKSTLLNALLNEEKALVSEIPGTTRDVIEDEIILNGVSFRFIDTAGLRETVDKVEAMGIERTREKMRSASLIIYLFDVNTTSEEDLIEDIKELRDLDIPYLIVGNKVDKDRKNEEKFRNFDGIVFIAAAHKAGLDTLRAKLVEITNLSSFVTGNVIVTNLRHYESLANARKSLTNVIQALDTKVTGDFLAQDIRQALYFLGEITGEVTTDDLLGHIFSKFCIGK